MAKNPTFVGTIWTFVRSQPVLRRSALWLIFAPMCISMLTSRLLTHIEKINRPDLLTLCIVVLLAVEVLILWGTACILTIGKRLLGSNAGKQRTSFKAVRKQARALVLPLLLTGILRMVDTLLFGLLLVVPGIIYFLRTELSPVVVAYEGLGYRPALRRSRNIVYGHTWWMLRSLLMLWGILYVLPVGILMGTEYLLPENAWGWLLTLDLVGAAILSITHTLYQPSLILLYKRLTTK